MDKLWPRASEEWCRCAQARSLNGVHIPLFVLLCGPPITPATTHPAAQYMGLSAYINEIYIPFIDRLLDTPRRLVRGVPDLA